MLTGRVKMGGPKEGLAVGWTSKVGEQFRAACLSIRANQSNTSAKNKIIKITLFSLIVCVISCRFHATFALTNGDTNRQFQAAHLRNKVASDNPINSNQQEESDQVGEEIFDLSKLIVNHQAGVDLNPTKLGEEAVSENLLLALRGFCRNQPEDCNLAAKQLNLTQCELDSETSRIFCIPHALDSKMSTIIKHRNTWPSAADSSAGWAQAEEAADYKPEQAREQQQSLSSNLDTLIRLGQWGQLVRGDGSPIDLAAWSALDRDSASEERQRNLQQLEAARLAANRPNRISTRAWRQPTTRTIPGRSSTFRVSLEEAERFLQSQHKRQQQQQRGALDGLPQIAASSLARRPQRPLTVDIFTGDGLMNDGQQRASGGGGGGASVRLHRSDATALQSFGDLLGGAGAASLMRTIAMSGGKEGGANDEGGGDDGTLTRGRRPKQPQKKQNKEQRASSLGAIDISDSPMSCNMRNFTFRATKTDETTGVKCWGDVTALVCYGGCDSGEIADWLFPHKKSIHKVCRHGMRVRRRAILSECDQPLADESLREYYYVDARDCVCKKCTSVDTTCLGTMSTPHLQTLGEAAMEVALNGD